jgi:prevent-host-death family protein
MRTVAVSEAKTRLSSLLEQAERGQEITITKHGRAVARLMPVAGVSRERLADAVAQLKRFRRG